MLHTAPNPLLPLLSPLLLFAAAASCGHWRMIDRRLAWFCINKCAQVEGAKIVLNENSHNTQHTHTLTHIQHTHPHSHPHTHLAWKWKVWRCVFHFVWSSQQKVYLKTNWKLLLLLLLLLLFGLRLATVRYSRQPHPLSPLPLLSGAPPPSSATRFSAHEEWKTQKIGKCSFYFFNLVFCFSALSIWIAICLFSLPPNSFVKVHFVIEIYKCIYSTFSIYNSISELQTFESCHNKLAIKIIAGNAY